MCHKRYWACKFQGTNASQVKIWSSKFVQWSSWEQSCPGVRPAGHSTLMIRCTWWPMLLRLFIFPQVPLSDTQHSDRGMDNFRPKNVKNFSKNCRVWYNTCAGHSTLQHGCGRLKVKSTYSSYVAWHHGYISRLPTWCPFFQLQNHCIW